MVRTISAVLLIVMFLGACVSADDPNRRTKQGAATGAVTGAVVGGVVGNQSGNKEKGAVVGAVVGAGVGAIIGRRMDQQQKELEQIEGVEVSRTAEDKLDVTIRNEVLFDTDSTGLRPASRTTLVDLARVFVKYPTTRISVEGHADAQGREAYNQTLSERRAMAVKSFLVDEGVPGSRISAIGFGETRPKTSNSTPEGRQQNRRVEITIVDTGEDS